MKLVQNWQTVRTHKTKIEFLLLNKKITFSLLSCYERGLVVMSYLYSIEQPNSDFGSIDVFKFSAYKYS